MLKEKRVEFKIKTVTSKQIAYIVINPFLEMLIARQIF